MTSAMTSFA